MPWDLDVAAIWAETGELAAADAADAENLARRGLLAALAAGRCRDPGPPRPRPARVRASGPRLIRQPGGRVRAGQALDVAPGGPALLGFAGGPPTTRSGSVPPPMMRSSG